jgi:uncharacterized caspase-like protein
VSGQRKALIIANDEYEHDELRNLLAPGADAEALSRVLGDPQIGEFTVQIMRNEPAHVMQAQLEELFSESRPDDVLLLHFSGHGLKNDSGELFFAASNTRPNRLGSTAVSADFVHRCMRDARSRNIVLLLDCCYGGAFAQGVRVRAAGNVNVFDSFPRGWPSGGRGRAVITASNAMEYAFEGGRLADDVHRGPSVFTSALVEGLATGDADRDEDGFISLDELYDYVFDKVKERNPHQTPSRQVELEGELYLARSRRRRIRPVPTPADPQAARADAANAKAAAAATVAGKPEIARRGLSQDRLCTIGSVLALVAGITKITGDAVTPWSPVQPPIIYSIASYALPAILVLGSLAALTIRNRRKLLLSCVAGGWFIAFAWVIFDILLFPAEDVLSSSKRNVASHFLSLAGDLMGVVAVVLLLAAIRGFKTRRHWAAPPAIPVLLLIGLTLCWAVWNALWLIELARLEGHGTAYLSVNYPQVSFSAVGLIAVWLAAFYALRADDHVLGGFIVGGWLIADSLQFLRFVTSGFTFASWAVGLNFLTVIAIAATACIAIAYIRHGRSAAVASSGQAEVKSGNAT